MAPSDVAIPLIQLVALFLPAWAVVMQIFSRIVRETNFRARPTLLPWVSFSFALAFMSLYLFGKAGFDIMRFFIESGAISNSGPLGAALMNVSIGSLAFVGMGSIVIMCIGFRHIDPPELYIAGFGAIVMALVMWASWLLLSIGVLFGGLFVAIVAMLTVLYRGDFPRAIAD